MKRSMTRINVDIPDDLHRRVKSAAALAALTVRDYVVAVFEGREPPPGPSEPERGRKR
jgi:hypothetical protein